MHDIPTHAGVSHVHLSHPKEALALTYPRAGLMAQNHILSGAQCPAVVSPISRMPHDFTHSPQKGLLQALRPESLFSLNSPEPSFNGTAPHYTHACYPVSPHTIRAGGTAGGNQEGTRKPSGGVWSALLRGMPRRKGPSEAADVLVPNLDVGHGEHSFLSCPLRFIRCLATCNTHHHLKHKRKEASRGAS